MEGFYLLDHRIVVMGYRIIIKLTEIVITNKVKLRERFRIVSQVKSK